MLVRKLTQGRLMVALALLDVSGQIHHGSSLRRYPATVPGCDPRLLRELGLQAPRAPLPRQLQAQGEDVWEHLSIGHGSLCAIG